MPLSERSVFIIIIMIHILCCFIMSHHHQFPLMTGLLLALALGKGRSQDFRDRWITRPPFEYEFPHVIYIEIPGTNKFCSGSLLHESWVLTAASCMYQGTQNLIKDVDTSVFLYAGVKDRTQLNDTHVQMRRSIKVRFPTEEYNCSYYSPALIKVNQPFTLNRTMGVDIIPVSTHSFDSHNHSVCKAGSYGADNRKNKDKTKLKKLDLRSYACNCTKEIKAAFRDYSVDKWLCGRTKDIVGICSGDFGMGMICEGELHGVSIGLMRLMKEHTCVIRDKHSPICPQPTNVGLFVDICYYMKWLSEFVCNIRPPSKPCKALAWHPKASLCFIGGVMLSYFVLFDRPK